MKTTIFALMKTTEIIKELIKLGFTQSQIAKIADCSQPAIAQLAAGKIKNPSFKIGYALLRFYEQCELESGK